MRKGGLALALLVIVALIVAWLTAGRLSATGKGAGPAGASSGDAVQQAREAVEQINAAQGELLNRLEESAP